MGSSKITTKDLSEPVIEALNTIDTVANQITTVDSNVNSIKTTVENNATGIANLNSRLTDARANYLDLLGDATNGLAAIKSASASKEIYYTSGTTTTLKTGITFASTTFNYNTTKQVISSFTAPADGSYRIEVKCTFDGGSTGYIFGPRVYFTSNPFDVAYENCGAISLTSITGSQSFSGSIYLFKGMEISVSIGYWGAGTGASANVACTGAYIKGTKHTS